MGVATQVLRGSGEIVTVTFTVDGTPTDPDNVAATVTITRDDGTAIATNATASRIDTGTYGYSLQPQADLDHLTAVWTAAFSSLTQSVTTYVDVVGGYYVSLAELRAMKNLDSITAFTTAELIDARQWFETLAENYCGQAFVPRYKRTRLTGSGTAELLLDMNVRTVRSVKDYTDAATYTAYTADELADIDIDPVGVLTRLTTGAWRAGRRNLSVVYEHGMDACPPDLREAAKNAIRYKLLDDNTGHREYALQTEVGIVRFGRPGPGRPTGDDEVDRVLNSYRLVAVG